MARKQALETVKEVPTEDGTSDALVDDKTKNVDEGVGEEAKTAEVKKEEEEAKTPPEPVALTKRKRKKKKTFDETIDDYLPSHERKTAKGGYAHTNKSKSRISKANTGNTPWNKGRNRSSADKAKIAAGVRARNRAVLLDKLKRLGLTEEEWLQKKKEIKYLRERIRRAKAANAQHKAALAEQKLKAALEATNDKAISEDDGVKQAENVESSEPVKEEATDQTQNEDGEEEGAAAVDVFSRDITWTPHSFGLEGQSYDQACAEGGPGGFVCCASCSKAYSAYLVQTAKDVEIQKTHKCGKEVGEILGFLDEACEKLDRAVKVARKLAPPLPPQLPEPEPVRKTSTRRSTGSKVEPDHSEWNLTSAIDIGVTEGVAV